MKYLLKFVNKIILNYFKLTKLKVNPKWYKIQIGATKLELHLKWFKI